MALGVWLGPYGFGCMVCVCDFRCMALGVWFGRMIMGIWLWAYGCGCMVCAYGLAYDFGCIML